MRRLSARLLVSSTAALVFLAPISYASAESTPSPSASIAAQQTPSPDEGGRHSDGTEHHRIDDGGNGTDSLQWAFVGAAIVIALGLAYNAGRRQRKKKSE
jgi:hypothetical protein